MHLHTPWSLLDGFARIDDLILLTKEYGMNAVGVSEHGNMHSHIEFYTKCKAAGLKPILAMEGYITPNRFNKKEQFDKIPQLWEWRPKICHLLMIAKNNEGYKNLISITTKAQLEGFYAKPRADYELIKKYGKGIIATSSCLGGEIPQLIMKGKYRVAKNLVRFYQKCFDEFYFEVQPGQMPEQIMVNNVLYQWSEEMNVPLMATSDVHMLKKEELPIHSALTVIGKRTDENDISVYKHCYFMSPEEMLSFGIPEVALRNSYEIGEKCNVEIEMGDMKFPKFDTPKGYDFDTYLLDLASSALFEYAMEKDIDVQVYYDRLTYELKVIKEKKLSAYMLIVWDFIKYAKDNDILVGPGRGSAAGSLVAYLLKITNLDPIRFDLLFERFLNPERNAMPDCLSA